MTRISWMLLVFFFFWSLHSNAQKTDSLSRSSVRFSTENELGALVLMRDKLSDEYQAKGKEWVFEFTSTNGITYGRLFAGIGVGVRKWEDDFVLPLFFHASCNLSKSENGLFLHTDLGNQFGTRRNNAFGDRETGNFYAAYGFGYYGALAKSTKLYLKVSVCHQRAEALGPYTGLGPSTYPEPYLLNYLFFRVSLGVKFTK